MPKDKPNINVAFVGHVDHGKSTCVGQLMFQTGNLPDKELKKLKEEAEKHGKAGFEFAYFMDKVGEERERGLTIELAYQKLDTDNYQVTIIDAPGHRDFVKNMITGTSQADAAFLVVAADSGVQPQTKEHLWLLKTMGVDQIAVVVNKMDVVDYDESKYNEVKKEVGQLMKGVGYNPDDVEFIAASGLKGDNIGEKSDNMDWYSGNTVIEKINKLEQPEEPVDLPLRMPIQDVYEITGVGTVPVGKIETGKMKPGDKVKIVPGKTGEGVEGEIKTVEAHHEELDDAEAGDNVGVNIRGVGKKDMARGDVICAASDPAPVVEEFTAQMAVINHPTVVAKGYTPVFHIHTAQVPCQITELIHKIDPKTGEASEENPDYLKNGDVAMVKVKPKGNVVIETQEDNPHMSRFAIRDQGATVAAGMCVDVKEKK